MIKCRKYCESIKIWGIVLVVHFHWIWVYISWSSNFSKFLPLGESIKIWGIVLVVHFHWIWVYISWSSNFSKFLPLGQLLYSYHLNMTWWLRVSLLDARSTGDQEGLSSRLRSGNILLLRLIMKSFLRSLSPFRWFKKGSCQLLAKECALSTG